MSYDDREYAGSRYYDDRRYQRDPNYAEARDNYVKSQAVVPRRHEDADYSVEEIRREYSRDVYRGDYDDERHQRSSKYDRDYDRDYERREGKKSSRGYDDEKKRRRMLSNQEKILAAIIGGAIAVGGKELYDRREAHVEGHKVQRNALSSAALGAAGALAAYGGADYYSKHAAGKEDKAVAVYKGRDYDYDSEEEGSPKSKGYMKFVESALAAAGLGSAVKALAGDSDDRSDTRSSRRGSRSPSREGKSKGKGTNKIQKAAMASLIAGATEAFRVAKEPGSWKGEKARRIFTAAAGAATLDAAQDDKHSKLSLAESVIGGLLGNRLVNGSRKDIEEDKRTGRSRSRSRARSDSGGGGGSSGVSGLAALATAGLGALGTKKLLEHRSRSRSRRRGDSADSYDSRDRPRRSRSRSVVDSARRSLAKIGLGNGPDDDLHDEPPRRKKSSSRHYSRHESADSYDGKRHRSSGRERSRDSSYDKYDKQDKRDKGRHHDKYEGGSRRRSSSRARHGKGGDSESDLGSSSGDEKQARKMRDGRHRH